MDRYLVISSDGHAGLPPEQYKTYVQKKYHQQFDDTLAVAIAGRQEAAKDFLIDEFNKEWSKDIQQELTGAWDPAERNKVADGDGIAAEILFPDGITEHNAPPFGADLSFRPMQGKDVELQWEGCRAHNRWLADFCQDNPVRRLGLAMVPLLYNVDEAIEEIKWAKKNGFTGIMIQPLMGDYDAYNHKKYEPVWALCEDYKMPIHVHGGPTPEFDMSLEGAMGIYLTEFSWWVARPLWTMLFGGVFERYPNLKFGFAEANEFWIPSMLQMMDVRASVKHTSGKLGDFRSNLTMKPSEYFRRNVWVGASALFDPDSVAVRHDIGIDRVMWGSDYPHPEGSWPKTHEKMMATIRGLPDDELTAMLGMNAVNMYELDVEPLNAIASKIGPLKSDFIIQAA